MASISSRLGLTIPTTLDQFSTKVLADNWKTLDASPGRFICTSTTRPSWGSAQRGRQIFETNTGLTWDWTASGWVRSSGMGILKTSGGGVATVTRESDFISTIKDYRIVMKLSNVVVPAGKRPLLFQFNNYYVDANDDYGFISVFRSHTPGQSQQFPYWVVGTSQYNISSGSQSGILAGGLAAGTYNWSIQAHAKSDSGDRFELHGPMTFQILEL